MASQWSRPAVLESLATITSCERGEVVCSRGDPAEHWYRVVSGIARESAVLPDGRQQIVDLLVPGDHFGFSSRNRHILTVEAVQDSVVARYPREHVDRLADSDPAVGRYVRTKAFEAIARSYARMLIVRLATPLERVGAFLAELSERPLEGSADSSVLSLAREDLAEYLGLPVETVSRALADLRVNGAITPAARRRVTITSREAHEG